MSDDVWDYCPACDDWGVCREADDGSGWVCARCAAGGREIDLGASEAPHETIG